MMIDYNVSDHWREGEPAWLKSLVSSLDRHHGVSTVLPLTVVIEETTNWVELASRDAWMKGANRESLRLDLVSRVVNDFVVGVRDNGVCLLLLWSCAMVMRRD